MPPVPTVVYHHTQPAHAVRVLTLIAVAACVAAVLLAPKVREPGWYPDAVLLVLAGVMAVAAALFWSMTVEVTDADLIFWFGSGLIRKRIPLPEIATVEEARTTVWQGWGIHWTRRGWLYNVSGFGAVLVRLKTGKSLLVGTDEPGALADAIRSGISATAGGATDG
jgi:hypothetical protein